MSVDNNNIDATTEVGDIFHNSFVTDGTFSEGDLKSMAENWIDIEDDEEVREAVIDDELEIDIESVLKEDSDDEILIKDTTVDTVSIRKYTHSEAMKALEVANTYARENKMSMDTLNTFNKLRFQMQSQHAKKPKKSPSIYSFFGPKK